MKIKELRINSFRNIENIIINPVDNVNIIYGNNAQGKTNIIEAIWLFTGNNSFRNAKINELLKFNTQRANLDLVFEDYQRQQKANIKINNQKRFTLNSVPLKKSSQMQGEFFCVVFSPTDLELAKGSPALRRKFIDIAITQIKPQYGNYLECYDNILEQRNALLKNGYKSTVLKDTLDIWDIQLAKYGTIITSYRNDYVKNLKNVCKKIYEGLSSSKEELDLKYVSTVYNTVEDVTSYDDNTISEYHNKLKSTIDTDIKAGFTTIGIHRDDLDIYINSLLVKPFGSQGQKRSCVIALKLAEAEILKIITKEKPIILLDDVMSELDEYRQNYILNHVKDKQVFITCCDFENTIKLEKGKIFKIQQGEVFETKEINKAVSE